MHYMQTAMKAYKEYKFGCMSVLPPRLIDGLAYPLMKEPDESDMHRNNRNSVEWESGCRRRWKCWSEKARPARQYFSLKSDRLISEHCCVLTRQEHHLKEKQESMSFIFYLSSLHP